MQAKRRFVALAGLLALGAALEPGTSMAQSHPEVVDLQGLTAELYRPDSGPAPHVGVVYENRAGSLTASLCQQMAKRGFLLLCMAQSASDRAEGGWENVALDVKRGIEFLRTQRGITKIVLYGHSGGGAVASFYEAVAENGLAFCQDPKKLSRCSDKLANLPKADAVLFPDAHPGLGVMNLRMINPSIKTEGGKSWINPDLDPFDPANGYNPNGSSHYSKAFQARYFSAQAAEMDALIDQALAVRDGSKSGALSSPADGGVVIPAFSFNNHLDQNDPDVDSIMATSKPRKFLRNDGSIVTQIVRSTLVGVKPMPARNLTLTTTEFLESHATRAKDAVDNIDYCTSDTNTACNIRYIHVPVLFIAMGANTFISDEERMFERSPSMDKDYIVVEGAEHSGVPCKPCEKTPDEFSNSEKNMFDYIHDWIDTHVN